MTEQKGKQVQIKATEDDLKGRYSNTTRVLHTKEEFVIDFLSVFGETGTLNSRVILSPAHLKRVTGVLANNLKKYEEKFGKIDSSREKEQKIGFA